MYVTGSMNEECHATQLVLLPRSCHFSTYVPLSYRFATVPFVATRFHARFHHSPALKAWMTAHLHYYCYSCAVKMSDVKCSRACLRPVASSCVGKWKIIFFTRACTNGQTSNHNTGTIGSRERSESYVWRIGWKRPRNRITFLHRHYHQIVFSVNHQRSSWWSA